MKSRMKTSITLVIIIFLLLMAWDKREILIIKIRHTQKAFKNKGINTKLYID